MKYVRHINDQVVVPDDSLKLCTIHHDTCCKLNIDADELGVGSKERIVLPEEFHGVVFAIEHTTSFIHLSHHSGHSSRKRHLEALHQCAVRSRFRTVRSGLYV